MVILLKCNTMKLNTKLFLYFSSVFVVFMVIATVFLYQNDKKLRQQQLDHELAIYTHMVHLCFEDSVFLQQETTQRIKSLVVDSALRITVIALDGHIVFDSEYAGDTAMDNHLGRIEIQEALSTGIGKVARQSNSLHKSYYYFAEKFPDMYVRASMPYNVTILSSLKSNEALLELMAVLLVIAMVVLYFISQRFSDNIAGHETSFKEQLTLNISHELKTPVSSILGYTESIINNPELPKEKRDQFIDRTYKQALRLKSLLEDISILNKLSKESELYQRVNCNLADIIQNVINDVQLQAEKNHALIEKRIFPQMPILGNPTLLYSIFRNMLDNALLYGGEGVVIRITCFNSDAKQYYFTFTDNGPGVPEEHVAHLFERFYRVDSGRSRKMGGTGLGLAIVKHAVRFHGGNIAAENRPEGGLGFMFNLKKK